MKKRKGEKEFAFFLCEFAFFLCAFSQRKKKRERKKERKETKEGERMCILSKKERERGA